MVIVRLGTRSCYCLAVVTENNLQGRVARQIALIIRMCRLGAKRQNLTVVTSRECFVFIWGKLDPAYETLVGDACGFEAGFRNLHSGRLLTQCKAKELILWTEA